MATLKTEEASESGSARSKMQEYEICFSGFPKIAYQGYQISKWAGEKYFKNNIFFTFKVQIGYVGTVALARKNVLRQLCHW